MTQTEDGPFVLRDVLTDEVMRNVLVILPPPANFPAYAAAVRERLCLAVNTARSEPSEPPSEPSADPFRA